MIRVDPVLLIAAVAGGSAVGLGAYGAHGLQGDDFVKHAWETGVAYQMWHALALIGVALLRQRRDGWRKRALGFSAALFTAGIIGFCGSLYGFGLTGEILVPGLAPSGGMALMAGWLAFAVAAIEHR